MNQTTFRALAKVIWKVATKIGESYLKQYPNSSAEKTLRMNCVVGTNRKRFSLLVEKTAFPGIFWEVQLQGRIG